MTATLQPGSTVSHYRIVSRIGAGGMGEVYLAQDETLGRSVALKIIPPERAGSEERVRRFVQEARSASALNHPNIVTIHEIGRAEVSSPGAPPGAGGVAPGAEGGAVPGPGPKALPQSIHYIAMELVTGHTLVRLIHDEKTDLRTLLSYLAQAADGLARAHASGIVHRDIKPENIMVTKDGYAKILDFGLVKLVERREAPSGASDLPTATAQISGEGILVGTVSYMSPEQIQGRAVDHRADIFAFGSVLYEATTRRRAFSADTDVETMHRILKDDPAPIEELNPEAPAILRRLIRRCLAKNPDKRLQSMKDLAIELNEIVEEFDSLSASESSGSGPVAAPVAARRLPKMAWAGMAAALVVIAVVVGIATRGLWTGDRGGAAGPAQQMQITRLTTDGATMRAVLSPDGRYLARIVREREGFGIRVMQIATGSDVPVLPPTPPQLRELSFSPDGEYIYFTRTDTNLIYCDLRVIPTLGGTPRRVLFDVDSPVGFTPDGKRFAFVRGAPQNQETSVMIADADGGNSRKLVAVKYPEGLSGVPPVWSPDGRRFATVVMGGQRGFACEIVTAETEGGAFRPLGEPWNWIGSSSVFQVGNSLAWLPDGRGLVLAGARGASDTRGQIWLVAWPSGEATRLTNDLSDYGSVSLSADGRSLVSVQYSTIGGIWAVPVDDPTQARPLTAAGGPEDSPADVTPGANGTLLYVQSDARGSRIMSLPQSGGTARVLYSCPFQIMKPRQALQEGSIAFTAIRDGRTMRVWRMDADGGNATEITGGSSEWFQDISPDGRWIWYYNPFVDDLWRMPARGGPATLVDSTVTYWGSRVSPDGRLIATPHLVVQGGLAVQQVVVSPAEGGAVIWRRAWPGPLEGEWTSDGRGFSYALPAASLWNVWQQSMDGGPPKQVTAFDSQRIYSHCWSADGRTLFVVRGDQRSDAVMIRGWRR